MVIVMVDRRNRSKRSLGTMRPQPARKAGQAGLGVAYTEWAGWVRLSTRHIWVKRPAKMGGKL